MGRQLHRLVTMELLRIRVLDRFNGQLPKGLQCLQPDNEHHGYNTGTGNDDNDHHDDNESNHDDNKSDHNIGPVNDHRDDNHHQGDNTGTGNDTNDDNAGDHNTGTGNDHQDDNTGIGNDENDGSNHSDHNAGTGTCGLRRQPDLQGLDLARQLRSLVDV